MRRSARLGLVREELGERELANRCAERVPARSVAVKLDEEAAPGERPEDLGRALDPERLAQLGREALERRDEAHELLDAGRLVREDLGREIREQRPARAADALECLTATRGWHASEGLDGEPDGCGPASRRAVQLGRRLRVVVAGQRAQEPGGLLDVEREVRAAQLEHLALPAQPLDGERGLDARREHDVDLGRCLPAERLDELHRPGRLRELVHVVDDEHEVAAELGLQRLADERRDSLRACPVVGVRVGTGCARDRAGDLGRDGRYPEPKRIDDPTGEDRERLVFGGRAVPRAVVARGPRRQERRLAEPGIRDDGREPSLERLVETCEQTVAAEQRRRGDRRQELRRRCRARRGGRRHEGYERLFGGVRIV